MRAVDLFAGCGGLSLGFENQGFEILAAFDNWQPAIDVYRANLPHPIFKLNLSDVETATRLVAPLAPEIIIGGPPCQDFSHAGKRSEGTRADLTVRYAEIVCRVAPRWFLMENVARAFSSAAFEEAATVFRDRGYGLTIAILDASFCGVPQKRKRLVCIGKMGESDGYLSEGLHSRLSKVPTTVREYLGDELDIEHYYRHPRNYSRRAVYSIDEPAATIRGVNRPVPSGYKRHPGDSTEPGESRPLTTAERARIQTFPSGYKWLGTKTDCEQMVGNAVPVKLAEFVAGCIRDYEIGAICAPSNVQLPLRLSGGEDNIGYRQLHELASEIGGSRAEVCA